MREELLDRTFCFVDIAGYTALTDTHGAQAAAELVQQFEELLMSAIGEAGSVHETIGDCAFLVFADVHSCCSSLTRLFELIDDRENFPVLRAGFHHGSALLKNNRYFGPAVNLAARVSAQAKGGQVLCTRVVAEELSQASPDAALVASIGIARLRNIAEPIELFEVIGARSKREVAIDPVCKMQVSRSTATGHIVFSGEHYYFCSIECVEKFLRSPSVFLDADP